MRSAEMAALFSPRLNTSRKESGDCFARPMKGIPGRISEDRKASTIFLYAESAPAAQYVLLWDIMIINLFPSIRFGNLQTHLFFILYCRKLPLRDIFQIRSLSRNATRPA